MDFSVSLFFVYLIVYLRVTYLFAYVFICLLFVIYLSVCLSIYVSDHVSTYLYTHILCVYMIYCIYTHLSQKKKNSESEVTYGIFPLCGNQPEVRLEEPHNKPAQQVKKSNRSLGSLQSCCGKNMQELYLIASNCENQSTYSRSTKNYPKKQMQDATFNNFTRCNDCS